MAVLAAATMAACAKVRSNREHCWTFVRNSKQTGINVSRLWGAGCLSYLSAVSVKTHTLCAGVTLGGDMTVRRDAQVLERVVAAAARTRDVRVW